MAEAYASDAVSALGDAMGKLIGAEHVAADEDTRALYSQDVYSKGGLVDLVARPANAQEAAACLKACADAGFAVFPRGGGMSYTRAFISDRPGGVCLDTARMNRVLEINAGDMYVRAEAGCSWADLHKALKPTGLRTPFWGPLSGISSTVGGGLSQNNAFFGAGTHGPTGESVLSVSVALPDGSILKTGTGGTRGASPFFRHYGPDLTGLFAGDAGALGVKVEIVFKLIPAPAHERWGSFSFSDRDAMANAMAGLARLNLACEVFGFDPGLTAVRMQRASLLADAKTLAKVVTGQGNLLKGMAEGAKMALAGRSFLDEADYNLHFVVEGASAAGVADAYAACVKVCEAHRGKSVEPTIPKVIRANPFTPLNNMIGPQAERWVPVHGIVPNSSGPACWAEIDAYFATLKPRFEAEGVMTGFLTTTLGATGYLIEPVFLWPEGLYPLHEASVEADYLKSLKPKPANPAAGALVAEARQGVIDIFTAHGAAHFQIGRAYPYAQTREPGSLALLKSIKAALDPHGVINPGALGLGGEA